ncbi:hypothetical protein WR25_16644 [Diploscapter pachys]|uniref:Uncharacterized protein n=1 Tax=Diploscapter pachys TaxID=2018661 RepID=A0A2A2M5S0_9BILA|nr:hypothetical protein WR25_16644 [Diploscapter pachys]
MPAVRQQAIGNIQRRRGQAAQALAQLQLRHGRPVMLEQWPGHIGCRLAFAQHQRQGPCRITKETTNTQQVARLRAATAQRLAGRHPAEHGHG